jgi:hypothetical protein
MKKVSWTLMYFLLFSFVFFGMWEWIQSWFFKDVTPDINKIIYFRIHCTLGDMMILSLFVGLWGGVKRGFHWFYSPGRQDYLAVSAMAVLYTAISEYIHVHILHNWGYSDLMPLLPGIGIGLVPLLQWAILPALVIKITKDHLRGVS